MSGMDEKCVCMYVCVCVCGRAGRFPGGFFRHDRAITTRPVGDTQCGSSHVVLSNTNNCAVKPLFSVLLRKVCQLAESERRRGAQEGEEGERRERRYHGGVIKEAKSGEETLRRYHWHLGSL